MGSRRRAFFEPLEHRLALTGITAALSGSTLMITGTSQNDTIVVELSQSGAEINVFDNGTLAFTFAAAAVSAASITAGDGHDTVTIDSSFGTRPATILGEAGDDTLTGGSGNDILAGGLGDDTLSGGDGDDWIIADLADGSSLFGGSGTDSLNFNYETANLTFSNTAATSFEAIYGGSGNDTLDTSAYAGGARPGINITGGPGEDVLIGGPGNDYLQGDAQDDVLTGGTGNDTLVGGVGADDLSGEADTDWLVGDVADLSLDGGEGSDSFTFEAETEDVEFENTGAFEAIYGGSGDDRIDSSTATWPMTILGGGGDDWIVGGSGNDQLQGGDGDDEIYGGPGSDYLTGGGDADRLFGDAGDDWLIADAEDDDPISILSGGDGSDSLDFTAQTTSVHFTNSADTAIEAIYGGSAGDTIDSSAYGGGAAAGVVILGYGGNDTLLGGPGSDNIQGNDGDDTLRGRAGDDTMTGGTGADSLYGGAGTDTLDPGNDPGDVSYPDDDPPGGGITLEILPPGPASANTAYERIAYEGTGFDVIARVSPPGTYTLMGDGYGYYEDFPVTTNSDGTFTVSYLYFDDGPSPGNGTPSDVHDLTMTVWLEEDENIRASDETTVTVHNLDPTLDIWWDNGEVYGIVSEQHPAVVSPDVQTITIDWGDGHVETLPDPVFHGNVFNSGGHTYADPTLDYTVTVKATDDDGGSVEQFEIAPATEEELLTIYYGQFGDAVPDAEEIRFGGFTVANKNDTDGDGFLDREVEDWIVNGGTGTSRGEDEIDLMRLDVKKPRDYTEGSTLNLTLSRPDDVRLWADSTRHTVVLDGGNSLAVEFTAQESTKTYWVELMEVSSPAKDYTIEALYNNRRDKVVATAVWANEISAEDDNKSAATILAAYPGLDRAGVHSGPKALVTLNDGTGLKYHDNRYFNAIVIEYVVLPQGIWEVAADRVKFDITRRMDVEYAAYDAAGQIIDPQGDQSFTHHFEFPLKYDAANDDPHAGDESALPDDHNVMFVQDAPSLPDVIDFPGVPQIERRNLFGQFEEFVRVTFPPKDRAEGGTVDAVAGTQNPLIVGSRSSPKLGWSARHTLIRNGDRLVRTTGDVESAENYVELDS